MMASMYWRLRYENASTLMTGVDRARLLTLDAIMRNMEDDCTVQHPPARWVESVQVGAHVDLVVTCYAQIPGDVISYYFPGCVSMTPMGSQEEADAVIRPDDTYTTYQFHPLRVMSMTWMADSWP